MRCGIDTVIIARIKQMLEPMSSEQLAALFSTDELAYCYKQTNPWPNLAARFAAKEACLKCFPRETTLHDLEANDFALTHDNYGGSVVLPSEKVLAIMSRYQLTEIIVSISHSADNAVAMVIVS